MDSPGLRLLLSFVESSSSDFPYIDCLFFREDCTIPTLDETIEFAMANDVILLFDVKGGVFCGKVKKQDMLYAYS